MRWFVVFLETYLLETPIYVLGLRKMISPRRGCTVSLILNIATHPIVFCVLPKLVPDAMLYGISAEFFAITAEGLILTLACHRLKWQPAQSWLWFMGLSCVANIFSASVGLLVYYVLDTIGITYLS